MHKNRRRIYNGLSGVIGYFSGTLLYDLLFKKLYGDHPILKIFVILITALSIGGLSSLYLNYKYPQKTESKNIEENDERGQFIRGKSSNYTLFFIACLSLILFTYAYLKNYHAISYMIAVGYILTLIFKHTVQSILENRH